VEGTNEGVVKWLNSLTRTRENTWKNSLTNPMPKNNLIIFQKEIRVVIIKKVLGSQ
jgi:hypothetical protein